MPVDLSPEDFRRLTEAVAAEVMRRLGRQSAKQMPRSRTVPLSEADRKHGYRFGCDGLMSIEECCALFNISRWTLNARIEAGHIRKGKHIDGRAVVICRRSVQQYLGRIEL